MSYVCDLIWGTITTLLNKKCPVCVCTCGICIFIEPFLGDCYLKVNSETVYLSLCDAEGDPIIKGKLWVWRGVYWFN